MKKIILFLLVLLLAGCATWEVPESPASVYQRDQFNLLRQQIDLKKADYNKRLNEVEQAYSDGKLRESEYLMLKNNLKREWSDYQASTEQRMDFISQETHRLMRSQY